MKAGKEGPMQKNFGGALKSNKFLGELATAREKGDKTFNVGGKTFDVKSSAKPKLKDNAPMMRMDPSAMKAMGKPAPVKMSHPMKTDRGRKAAEERKKPKFGEPGYKEPFEGADKFLTEDEMKKYEPTYND